MTGERLGWRPVGFDTWEAAFDEYQIKESLRTGLHNYLIHNLHPGSFLTSIIANDLYGAVHSADPTQTIEIIRAVAALLNNEAPADCWGSHEAIARWCS